MEATRGKPIAAGGVETVGCSGCYLLFSITFIAPGTAVVVPLYGSLQQ